MSTPRDRIAQDKTAPPNKKLSDGGTFRELPPIAIVPRQFLRHYSLLLGSQRLDSRALPPVVRLPEAPASRSVATSPRTAHGSDVLPPASANSSEHALPAAHRSLPAVAACWPLLALSGQFDTCSQVHVTLARGLPCHPCCCLGTRCCFAGAEHLR